MRMTKIICTLGPAVDDEQILKSLIKSGMDVARFNFSHGTHEDHLKRIERLKKVKNELNVPVSLLLDTKGPEIRLGKFENNEIHLNENDEFCLCNKDIIGNKKICSVSHKNLYEDVNKGTIILINDGLVALKVVRIIDKDIYCRVLNGGILSNNKGVNIPETDTHLPSITEQDIEDIKFGIKNGFDTIAASFIRKASDVLEIRKILKENNGENIKIISKIENREGVNNFNEILKVSDGIMVARGDLGVEIPMEEVPIIQKKAIEKCYKCGKPVITATQMLESMIKNPRPTRAESSDVANAIYDGTSAIMLSGESAVGKYPIESVQTMSKIAEKVEEAIDYSKKLLKFYSDVKMKMSITNAISYATCISATHLKASAIITITESGQTAKMISKFRPGCPIIALTNNPIVQKQLMISWGIKPILISRINNIEDMFSLGIMKAIENKFAKEGDIIVITAGDSNIDRITHGSTNLLKVHTVNKNDFK